MAKRPNTRIYLDGQDVAKLAFVAEHEPSLVDKSLSAYFKHCLTVAARLYAEVDKKNLEVNHASGQKEG